MYLVQSISIVALLATATIVHQPQDSTPDPNSELVCKQQKKTGTRFAKKTCRTRAHWDAMSENAKREAEENFNKPVINIDKGN